MPKPQGPPRVVMQRLVGIAAFRRRIVRVRHTADKCDYVAVLGKQFIVVTSGPCCRKSPYVFFPSKNNQIDVYLRRQRSCDTNIAALFRARKLNEKRPSPVMRPP
jgi:hypothetical protein